MGCRQEKEGLQKSDSSSFSGGVHFKCLEDTGLGRTPVLGRHHESHSNDV